MSLLALSPSACACSPVGSGGKTIEALQERTCTILHTPHHAKPGAAPQVNAIFGVVGTDDCVEFASTVMRLMVEQHHFREALALAEEHLAHYSVFPVLSPPDVAPSAPVEPAPRRIMVKAREGTQERVLQPWVDPSAALDVDHVGDDIEPSEPAEPARKPRQYRGRGRGRAREFTK